MKMTQSAKLFTGLGLMAGLFWGCQDLLSQKDGPAKEPDAISGDASALRLSIKDDSACREQWNVILDARTAGLADSAVEKSFLADCVTEINPGKGKLPPVIPPHLQPDSISRCRWIVSQIDGGRDEMTVSYKRYCPEDCDTLAAKDSTRHRRLCRDHRGHGADTTKPKPPKPPFDSCKTARDSLAKLDSASADAASLRQFLAAHCGKPPRPDDTLPKPPKPPIDTTKPRLPEDSCKILRARLQGMDSASDSAASMRQYLAERCSGPPRPDDTLPKPPKDTLPKPPKPTPLEDSCRLFQTRLIGMDSASDSAVSMLQFLARRCGKPTAEWCNAIPARLAILEPTSNEAIYMRLFLLERCGKAPLPDDTLPKPPKPPKDTLPGPIPPVKPAPNCDALRAKLLTLDPASEDSKLLVDAILVNCTEAKP